MAPLGELVQIQRKVNRLPRGHFSTYSVRQPLIFRRRLLRQALDLYSHHRLNHYDFVHWNFTSWCTWSSCGHNALLFSLSSAFVSPVWTCLFGEFCDWFSCFSEALSMEKLKTGLLETSRLSVHSLNFDHFSETSLSWWHWQREKSSWMS